MNQRPENRTLPELFTELTMEMRTLLQKELELFKVEMTEKGTRLLKDVAALGIGVVMAYTALLTLVAAVVLIIGIFLPYWASALIVAAVTGGVGFLLIQKGRKDIQRARFTPEQTAETVKETAQWAKAQMK